VDRMIEDFELKNYRKNVCKDLSKGTKQRLMIATAFIHKPILLFLDEPFINLDPIYQKKIRDYIISYAKKGNTIFMATHIIELAKKICTRVGIIKNGKIIKIVDELENLEDIFLREFEND
ncbi:TPA: ATP-binding cassette domain-containing protein, partial [Candidatus Aciduliprofundum boonei]|nr:ATP-binding cassette domain-containing protein [Candidatus Aciduliprofundum boonei]